MLPNTVFGDPGPLSTLHAVSPHRCPLPIVESHLVGDATFIPVAVIPLENSTGSCRPVSSTRACSDQNPVTPSERVASVLQLPIRSQTQISVLNSLPPVAVLGVKPTQQAPQRGGLTIIHGAMVVDVVSNGQDHSATQLTCSTQSLDRAGPGSFCQVTVP